MRIEAASVKDLRDKTQAGLLDCRKALEQAGGDVEKAELLLREMGAIKASKKADRETSEGMVAIHCSTTRGALVSVLSETDFVARSVVFNDFAHEVARAAAGSSAATVEELVAVVSGNGLTVEQLHNEALNQLGENIRIGNVLSIPLQGKLASYRHGNKIGVIVDYRGGDEGMARDVAMHIAATNPLALSQDSLDPNLLEQEANMARAQLKDSGKPAHIVDKIIENKVAAFIKENVLLDQEFVKDPSLTIRQLLESNKAQLYGFIRLAIGE